jgi:hypothetical protein
MRNASHREGDPYMVFDKEDFSSALRGIIMGKSYSADLVEQGELEPTKLLRVIEEGGDNLDPILLLVQGSTPSEEELLEKGGYLWGGPHSDEPFRVITAIHYSDAGDFATLLDQMDMNEAEFTVFTEERERRMESFNPLEYPGEPAAVKF